MSPKKLFNTFAKAEAVTWTLLITALILRANGFDPVAVAIAGSIHGAVFLAFAVTAALTGVNQRWGFVRTAFAVMLAIVPFATIPLEIRQDLIPMIIDQLFKCRLVAYAVGNYH